MKAEELNLKQYYTRRKIWECFISAETWLFLPLGIILGKVSCLISRDPLFPLKSPLFPLPDFENVIKVRNKQLPDAYGLREQIKRAISQIQILTTTDITL